MNLSSWAVDAFRRFVYGSTTNPTVPSEHLADLFEATARVERAAEKLEANADQLNVTAKRAIRSADKIGSMARDMRAGTKKKTSKGAKPK